MTTRPRSPGPLMFHDGKFSILCSKHWIPCPRWLEKLTVSEPRHNMLWGCNNVGWWPWQRTWINGWTSIKQHALAQLGVCVCVCVFVCTDSNVFKLMKWTFFNKSIAVPLLFLFWPECRNIILNWNFTWKRTVTSASQRFTFDFRSGLPIL